MDLSFKVEGLDRLEKATKAVRDSVAQQLVIALDASGRKVVGDAKRSILQGSKSGVTYKRGGVLHRASAAGEAPANDTGRLANSITHTVQKVRAEATIFAGRGLAAYARLLEFGTSRMGARPFFFPAVEKNRQWISDRLAKAVRDGASKATRK